MKKSTKILLIIALALFVAGGVIFTGSAATVGFDFTQLSSDKEYTEMNKTVESKDIKKLVIETQTGNITLGVSPDSDIHFSYGNTGTGEYILTEDKDTVSLVWNDLREHWYQYIAFDFNFRRYDVEVLIPADSGMDIHIESTTGDINLDALGKIGNLEADVTTGAVNITGIKAGDITASSTTGRVTVGSSEARDVTLSATTGRITAGTLECDGALSLKTTTGRIVTENTTSEKLSAKSTTGGISLEAVKADDISLKATTGSISGTIAMDKSEFNITSSTSTGSNSLPEHWKEGDKPLNVQTSTGSIRVEFAG